MAVRDLSKEERQNRLKREIEDNPFLTDKELAERYGVSVQTVRLDRLELGIPELRKRTRRVAEKAYSKVKSVSGGEIYGELIDIELGKHAISILETTPGMVYQKTSIVRGYPIFAQANSLAVALINAEVALTGVSRVKFKRPVKVGEKLVAKASVVQTKGNKYVIRVNTRVDGEQVFTGKFLVSAVDFWDGDEGE